MQCEICGNELKVTGSKNVITGDNSAIEQTELYLIQTLKCSNRQCSAYDKPVEIKHKLEFSEG